MEYERIHKVQTGLISPSKLRMKLMGVHHHRKKDGSNSNSSRTSPSKLVDSEFVNCLLASNSGDFDEEVSGPNLEVPSIEPYGGEVLDASQSDKSGCDSKNPPRTENSDAGCLRTQQMSRIERGNLSAIHPMRTLEDENPDYDSNASSSSFEFHKGERSVQSAMSRSHSRPIPSKWNDAEKWIMNRQTIQANYSKKTTSHNSTGRLPATNLVRVAPECASFDHKQSVIRTGLEKFSFVPSGSQHDSRIQSKDPKDVDQRDICTKSSEDDRTGNPGIRSVCMRDMGTEMTPATSLEPSRTATPEGSTTPLRSPNSSIPSTPRRAAPASTPVDHLTDNESQHHVETYKKELSEEEMKLKTRQEIIALGVQLGKTNIAEWASKDCDRVKNQTSAEAEDLQRIEIENRAVAWEEAEKLKHTARYTREEIKIRAWESQQKAKLESDMRKIEAQVEEMRTKAQAKMVKKMAMARQRLEEKMAAAEAKKSRDAERSAAQAEYIRQTGRIPTTHYICCGLLS